MSTDLDRVLTAIEGLRSDMREDNQQIWSAIEENRKCNTNLKLENERRKGELEKLKLKQKITSDAFVRHVENPEKHFQPFFKETLPQKLWRKKPEIAAGGGAGALIIGLITLALKLAGVIQ